MSNYLRSRLVRNRTNKQEIYFGYDTAEDGALDQSKVIVYDYRNTKKVDGVDMPTVTVMDTQLALALSSVDIVNGQFILKDKRRGD
jgi:uncharacterized protein YceK